VADSESHMQQYRDGRGLTPKIRLEGFLLAESREIIAEARWVVSFSRGLGAQRYRNGTPVSEEAWLSLEVSFGMILRAVCASL
jgi:hypothetical protein